MLKINVIAIGKVKEKYFSQGIEEYAKRLSRFCQFKIIELEEETFKKESEANVSVSLNRERDRILACPEFKGHVIVMAIEGEKVSSEGFAKKIKTLIDQGKGVITFVIGSSFGVSEEIKKRADQMLSFSQMTFPHTMFRLMLTEQIYRAFCINQGSAYHK